MKTKYTDNANCCINATVYYRVSNNVSTSLCHFRPLAFSDAPLPCAHIYQNVWLCQLTC